MFSIEMDLYNFTTQIGVPYANFCCKYFEVNNERAYGHQLRIYLYEPEWRAASTDAVTDPAHPCINRNGWLGAATPMTSQGTREWRVQRRRIVTPQ